MLKKQRNNKNTTVKKNTKKSSKMNKSKKNSKTSKPSKTSKTLVKKSQNQNKRIRKNEIYGLKIPISKVKKMLQNTLNGLPNLFLQEIKTLVENKQKKGLKEDVINNNYYSELSQPLKMHYIKIFDEVTGNNKKNKENQKPFTSNLDEVKKIISKNIN